MSKTSPATAPECWRASRSYGSCARRRSWSWPPGWSSVASIERYFALTCVREPCSSQHFGPDNSPSADPPDWTATSEDREFASPATRDVRHNISSEDDGGG